MDDLRLWQYKIIQFFHDPPGKPYTFWPGTGGHKNIAKELFHIFTGEPFLGYAFYPDWAVSGADRPVVAPYRKKGVTPLAVTWYKKPLVTHPLAGGYRLDVRPRGETGEPKADAEIKDEVLEEQIIALEELAEKFGGWPNKEELEKGFYRLWRLYREKLIFRNIFSKDQKIVADHLWAEMPADTRCPDHSIWDHLKMATALAFLSRKSENHEDPWAPWLFRFSIGPVQRFIQASRTSRDLWLSSFLLSDLIFHAMRPIIEQYGPDSIIYPDLRGNPLIDVWLYQKYPDALPEYLDNPSTFAAMLPGTFLALLPRGEDQGCLRPIEEMAKASQQGFENRWQELANSVKEWLKEACGQTSVNWQSIWERHHKRPPLYAIWTAIPWMMAEMPIDKKTGKKRPPNPDAMRQRALPAQEPGFRKHPPGLEADIEAIKKRAERLAPWLPAKTWARYELAREVYLRTNPKFTTMERGFDYATTHHQLVVRHGLRKQCAPDPVFQDSEPGEKCTLCGLRTALGGETGKKNAHLDSARQAARKFWSNKELDPEGTGAERLCGICAMKRFLVKAGQKDKKISGINKIWAGPASSFNEIADRDQEIRVPFPSTATIAAQKVLERLVTDASFASLLDSIFEAHKKAGLARTNFPRSLPRLAAARKKATASGRKFLEIEAQESLFPNAIEGLIGYWERKGDGSKVEKLKKLFEQVTQLYKQIKKLEEKEKTRRETFQLNNQIAIICIDGDNMGRLIAGDADTIEATWKDVLHPDAVEKIKKNKHHKDAGWLDLLEEKRLIGPSLHAFINRALGNFSHRIVPWVVEREFSGRLIYAGGDDVLCIAPADEALDIAARLMQLFSAAWIIDTDYHADPWKWRRPDWKGKYDQSQARKRFQIPKKPKPGDAIRLPVSEGDLEHYNHKKRDFSGDADGVLLPLLGSGCSISAGIAYGHFKTPMGVLLGHARHLLDQVAKKQDGKACMGLGHFSRNGLKSQFAMPWNYTNKPFGGVKSINKVVEGFKDGRLAKRLPYKLREITPFITAALQDKGIDSSFEQLLQGFFKNACGQKIGNELFSSALSLWRQGIKLNSKEPERAVEGLLLCRYLAGKEEGGDSE